jgi:hypothetical protein
MTSTTHFIRPEPFTDAAPDWADDTAGTLVDVAGRQP